MTIRVTGHRDSAEQANDATAAAEVPLERRWSVGGASVTGRAHVDKGLGCDDAFAYGTRDDFVVAAVADGAGSVTQTSAWGSYTVCDGVVTDALSQWFAKRFAAVDGAGRGADELMRLLFDEALHRLRSRADYYRQPVGELATTLSVVIARPGLAVLGQIGDGVIAVERATGVETVLIEEKSEYANLTWFVQSDNAFAESFRTYTATDITAFALSTDGMSYKITDVATGAAFVPFFEGAWSSLAAGFRDEDFARWLDGIQDDQTDDDKTLILARLAQIDRSGSGCEASPMRRVSSRWPAISPPSPAAAERVSEG
ncbi:PP2C family serine/threonine-protein phosphatase [Nocardia aurea]|uniref:PP2C family serine/threonine-protein phosphatase n=1 Tax=Nocardia aurea TaxID=2144174 RepID=UPI0033B72733